VPATSNQIFTSLGIPRVSQPQRTLVLEPIITKLSDIAASSTRAYEERKAALRFRFAPPADSHGVRGNNALTIKPDQSVGADQFAFIMLV
ncbi:MULTISPECIES: hypothetical protein, partial [unclassified Sphingobium]|uniref:hypothetical protein n=1 Tax=unclassified Sphingobium TaxID=2611147 RepID=UPI0035A64CF2